MAGERPDPIWPLPKFFFAVQFGDGMATVNFQEVDGLDSDAQVIDYRHGNNPSFAPIKMPGIGKVGNLTLHRGIFGNDHAFWDWYDAIKMNTIIRRTVVITRLDESRAPKQTWTLHNAWPTKVTATDLKSGGNEVAVESVEIAYETLTMAAP